MAAATPQITNTLKKAVGLLSAPHAELKATMLRQCQLINYPKLRIAVYGPFNHGKSTLLNALLGSKTLPIALVPTTGTAITITHGPEVTSRITLTDGSTLTEPGTALLQRYATLDDQRQMLPEVATVEVQCPHPLLKLGVELVDLPGTDDQTTHNQLVYTNLLETDVVIQLLDGRKLMTLDEHNQLQDWLLARELTTVLFVVNFLNLVEPAERRLVIERLEELTTNLPTTLPPDVSNFYTVDALPALRARLKGDMEAAEESGLLELEVALQSLVQSRLPWIEIYRLMRLSPLMEQLKQALNQQLHALDNASPSRREILQKRAQQLLQTGFQKSINDLETWLQLNNLLAQYQQRMATEYQAGRLPQWIEEALKPTFKRKQQTVEDWVQKARDMFDQNRMLDMEIPWPAMPKDLSPLGYEATYQYLSHCSKTTLLALERYKKQAQLLFTDPLEQSQRQRAGQKMLLENTLTDLQHLESELISSK